MRRVFGFTLIELMITVAIVAILAAIAYPSYSQSVMKTRREEAKRTLIEGAQLLESFYAMNLDYTGAVNAGTLSIYTPTIDFTRYYTLSASGVSRTGFTLSAVPTGSQIDDSCGTLTINNRQATTAAKNGCW